MSSITTTTFSATVSAASGNALTLTSTIGLYPGMYGNIIGAGGSPAGTRIRIFAVDSSTVIRCMVAPEGLAPKVNYAANFSAYANGTVYFDPQVVDVSTAPQSGAISSSDVVPTTNGTGNTYMSEVVGNKNDTTGNSIYGMLYRANKHFHSASIVRPSMAAGVTVTKSATPWTLGAFATIVPTNSITAPFDIHSINFDSISANGVFEIVFYGGADGAEVEIGRTRFTRTTAADIANDSLFTTPVQAANTQIKAKLAGSSSGADTVVVSIRAHAYT